LTVAFILKSPEPLPIPRFNASAAGQVADRRLGQGRAFLRRHMHQATRGAVTIVLLLALLSFQGSIGTQQLRATSPVLRIAAATKGDLSSSGLAAYRRTLRPNVLTISDPYLAGVPGWTPGGPIGWPIYNIEKTPTLVARNPTFDEARELNDAVPNSPMAIRPLPGFTLPVSSAAERDRALLCLAQAVYYEAGFESGEGQQAVAQVVLNRLRHPAYPKSVCGVVYQGSQRTTGCQFSFTCDGSLRRAASPAAWARARDVASAALQGFVYKQVGSSTHYHADYVFPYWAPTLVKLRQIGAHIFYRMTGPGGQPAAFNGRYAGGETSLSQSVLSGGDARTPDAPTVVEAPLIPAGPITRTVTLTLGGEQRTFQVQDPGSLERAPGALIAPRRQATPDEVQSINEKLKVYEQGQTPSLTVAPPSLAPLIPSTVPTLTRQSPAAPLPKP